MNSKNLMMLWIFTVLITWIGLAYLLATLAVIAIPFQDIFIQNLTNTIVIGFAFLFGTIAIVAVYCVDYGRFQRLDRSS